MHDLKTAKHVKPAAMETAIFNACRANSKRATQTVRVDGEAYRVSFTPGVQFNEHNAYVSDENGFVIAAAIVDTFDC